MEIIKIFCTKVSCTFCHSKFGFSVIDSGISFARFAHLEWMFEVVNHVKNCEKEEAIKNGRKKGITVDGNIS